MTNSRDIHVIYRSSELYAKYLPITIYSLLKNNCQYNVTVHILMQNGFSQQSKDDVNKVIQSFGGGHEVNFIVVDETWFDDPKNNFDIGQNPTVGAYTFLAEELLPGVNRGLLLGIDTLVMGDISELFTLDMEANMIGVNPVVTDKFINYIQSATPNYDKLTFCADVILLNFSEMRKQNRGTNYIKQRIINKDLILWGSEQTGMLDAYNDSIYKLNPKYSFLYVRLTERYFFLRKPNISILHYYGSSFKPWVMSKYSSTGKIYHKLYNEFYNTYDIKKRFTLLQTKSEFLSSGAEYHSSFFWKLLPFIATLFTFFVSKIPRRFTKKYLPDAFQ